MAGVLRAFSPDGHIAACCRAIGDEDRADIAEQDDHDVNEHDISEYDGRGLPSRATHDMRVRSWFGRVP